jgi:Ca-activated chloride channel homolog
MKKTCVFLAMVFSLVSFRLLEERTITGTVTSSEDNTGMPGVNILVKGTSIGTTTDGEGKYSITVPDENNVLVFSFIGMQTQEVNIGTQQIINVQLKPDISSLQECIVTTGYSSKRRSKYKSSSPGIQGRAAGARITHSYHHSRNSPSHNTEEYDAINENIFHNALKNPLSTFSIDVDAASYSNVRRFINNGQRPPKDAVRIEEMINYFDYEYKQPENDLPFSVYTEISTAPWNEKHKLVHIGLQGKKIPTDDLPPSNLVFLIDVSGSMDHELGLPLVKQSFRMLVSQLRPQDHVAIVVYAGAAGMVLEPTSGDNKQTILEAIENLEAGGSTAGGEGIRLAYALAKQHFKEGGNNRVILATDGDFNVGESSNAAMERLIEEKRQDKIFLTVLGYGMGNYKDSKMETLADKGNGNYAYIDNLTEAHKVFVNEFGGTLFTIAKDVKLQLEFNPAKVQAYRLIGYENRLLNDEDFNNDKKDAGDLGSGHTVTALYEVIPVGVKSEFFNIDDLKYQNSKLSSAAKTSEELLTIKLRYKKPDENVSKLIVHGLKDENILLSETSDNFRWSVSVAAFGMLLREAEYVKNFTYDQAIAMAQGARGDDKEGYRTEFINMAKSFGLIASR